MIHFPVFAHYIRCLVCLEHDLNCEWLDCASEQDPQMNSLLNFLPDWSSPGQLERWKKGRPLRQKLDFLSHGGKRGAFCRALEGSALVLRYFREISNTWGAFLQCDVSPRWADICEGDICRFGLTDVRPQIVSRVAARSSSMRRLGCNGRGSDFHYVPRKHKEGKAWVK